MTNNKPACMEIDHHTIKLIVGAMAITLAFLTSFFAQTQLESISASYHEGGWSRDILVGFLYAIAAFLMAYNGISTLEMVLSKTAAFAAIGVAMFPCGCGGHEQIIPYVHYISSALMFLVLVVFCYAFYKRARAKGHAQASLRSYIYAICGIAILSAISVLMLDYVMGGAIRDRIVRLAFYSEAAGLTAFGVAWLTASRILPVITSREERLSLSPYR